MSISEDIKELIQEGYFISDDTISVDLDKFESGECNKLIISGVSGSGKTTLGKQLAEKYKCPVIDSDDILMKLDEKYKTSKISNKELSEIMYREILKILNNNQKCIIGGISLASMYYSYVINSNNNFKILLNLPFIFLGKSAIKSGIDANKRDIPIPKNLKQLLYTLIIGSVRFPMNMLANITLNKLKNDRCTIKGAVIKPFEI